MALAHSPRIVRDGLVLYFDAANTKSYPGSGTTWYDLSGNERHGTLINEPTFQSHNLGCFQFDGTNDRVSFDSTYAKSICFWGRLSSGFPDLAALVAKTASGDGALRVRSANSGSFNSSPGANDFHTSSSGIMINGSKVTTPVGRTMLQDYFVGAVGGANMMTTISHNFANRRYKGRVYAVLLYKRDLTDVELLQNYNALKGRFGL
tara:strand:+ start:2271 stop:2888 length:618 start_codon:yes stop_codon:yes gene_type:complete